MTQHAGLSPERWAAFTRDQQLLMIANEMNRCRKLLAGEDRQRLGNGLERVLRLTDLTVQVNVAPTFRRELLRWRDLIAEMYISELPSGGSFDEAFLVLLRFSRATSEQIPFVLRDPSPPVLGTARG